MPNYTVIIRGIGDDEYQHNTNLISFTGTWIHYVTNGVKIHVPITSIVMVSELKE